MLLEQFGLGTDDIMFAIISIGTFIMIRYWLIKIYRRVRDIDSILGHYYKKDVEKEENK